MEQEILNTIKDISYPALLGLIIIILNRIGIFSLLVDLLRSKINGNTDKTIHEKLDSLEDNHLHDISGTLQRIEVKLDKINDNIIWVKSKMNNQE